MNGDGVGEGLLWFTLVSFPLCFCVYMVNMCSFDTDKTLPSTDLTDLFNFSRILSELADKCIVKNCNLWLTDIAVKTTTHIKFNFQSINLNMAFNTRG